MTRYIEIRPSIGTIANSVAFDVTDELSSEIRDFEKERVEIQFVRAETAFFTGGPAETLLIAISGGVATHIISRVIDKILSIIKEHKKKVEAETVKTDVGSRKPSIKNMELFSRPNEKLSASLELYQLNKLRFVVRDIDNNIDFELTEERTKCIKHFDNVKLKHNDKKA